MPTLLKMQFQASQSPNYWFFLGAGWELYFLNKIVWDFNLVVSDRPDIVTHGVDKWRIEVVCPILPSRCRPKYSRWSPISTTSLGLCSGTSHSSPDTATPRGGCQIFQWGLSVCLFIVKTKIPDIFTIISVTLKTSFFNYIPASWDVVLRLTFFPPTHPPPFSCLVVF
jgi:hypothetical protein